MAQQPAMSNSSELRTRILSALVMFPIAVGIIWIGHEVFLFFLILLSAFMAWEWARITGSKSHSAWVVMSVFVGASLLSSGLNLPPLMIIGLLFVGAFIVMLLARGSGFHGRILMYAGTLYIGAALLCAYWLRMQDNGVMLLLWVVAMVIATDIGAYIAGRLIGGPKLAPAISPNKTWAGLLGGMSGAATVGALFAIFSGIVIRDAVILGAALAVVAQLGDLSESWMKRRSGQKDSSNLIPGHGGILDRADGFLAATPAFSLYIYYSTSLTV